MESALFVWHTVAGTAYGDTLPPITEPITELTFLRSESRMKADGVRPHLSHPVHEAAARAALPDSLQVLRVNGCRLRTWPLLPPRLVEFYAGTCDFFAIPNLSEYRQLIVLDMPDNRVENLDAPLPPNLERLNLHSNCLRSIHAAKPATLQNVDIGNNCGLSRIREEEDRVHRVAVRRAAEAGQPTPAKRASAISEEWMPASVITILPRVVAAPAVIPIDVAVLPAAAAVRPGVFAAFQAAPAVRPPADRPRANPYTNAQSVHDSGIQASANANLRYLAAYRPEVPIRPNILEEIYRALRRTESLLTILFSTPRSYRIRQLLTTRIAHPYTINGFSPQQIVDRLWLRIMDFPEETRKEAITRFCQEVEEADGNCANGFMTRMANVLIGFDEHIVMQMNPREIIQARITATMARVRKSMNLAADAAEPWNYWRDVICQTWTDIEEIEMEYGEREDWLSPLIDPLLEHLTKLFKREERDTLDEQIPDIMERCHICMPASVEGAPTLQSYISKALRSELTEMWRS